MKKLAPVVREVWALTREYWQGEERWSAWGLLLATVALNLAQVYVNVLLNGANGQVFNALQAKDEAGFYRAFGSIILLIMLFLVVALTQYFLNQTLLLRWRRWLSEHYLSLWLKDRAFYLMRFAGKVDNPDQRIAEDLRIFTSETLGLGLGIVSSVVTLASFSAILWRFSGSATLAIPMTTLTLTVPGYMFWAAILYSGAGSVLAHLVGRPLIRLDNRQQRVEADFRFGLVRLREEAEGIALYGGEAEERRNVLGRFQALYDNVRRLILRNTQYLTFSILLSQLAAFFPLLVASPRYFSGAIQLGPLMQTANAFGHVNGALSWFIDNYRTFADWRATADRLREFRTEIANHEGLASLGARIEPTPAPAVTLDEVVASLPDGTPLLAPLSLALAPHEPVLLRGRSGSGKTTLFRVLAGLWPFASGRVARPDAARFLFLPQRPYMPIGSLREALWFPEPPPADGDPAAAAALDAAELGALARRLDERAHWGQVLSMGEQQRLTLARAFLLRPDWLFLDEATSAVDEEQEARLYEALRARLPATTVVSIAHRGALARHHARVVTLERGADGIGRLHEGAAAV